MSAGQVNVLVIVANQPSCLRDQTQAPTVMPTFFSAT